MSKWWRVDITVESGVIEVAAHGHFESAKSFSLTFCLQAVGRHNRIQYSSMRQTSWKNFGVKYYPLSMNNFLTEVTYRFLYKRFSRLECESILHLKWQGQLWKPIVRYEQELIAASCFWLNLRVHYSAPIIMVHWKRLASIAGSCDVVERYFPTDWAIYTWWSPAYCKCVRENLLLDSTNRVLYLQDVRLCEHNKVCRVHVV